jgi:hypothetical protein
MGFIDKKGNRSDMVVTLIAIFSIIMAGGISIATITTDQNTDSAPVSLNIYDADPLARAEQAAVAGIHAAKGHIQCHGVVEKGGLPDQYYANGARFMTVWDDLNLSDSTVHVVSTGYCRDANGEEHVTKLESIMKIDLLFAHQPALLQDYYNSGHGLIPQASDN